MIKVLKGFHKKQSSENLQVSLRSRRGYFFLKRRIGRFLTFLMDAKTMTSRELLGNVQNFKDIRIKNHSHFGSPVRTSGVRGTILWLESLQSTHNTAGNPLVNLKLNIYSNVASAAAYLHTSSLLSSQLIREKLNSTKSQKKLPTEPSPVTETLLFLYLKYKKGWFS